MENKAILTYCKLANDSIKAFADNLAEVTKGYDTACDYCNYLGDYPGTVNVEWNRTLEQIAKPYYSFQKATLDGVFKIIPGKHSALIEHHGTVISVTPEDGDMIFATEEDAEMVMKTIKANHLSEHIQNLIDSRARLREEVRMISSQIDEAVAERNSLF